MRNTAVSPRIIRPALLWLLLAGVVLSGGYGLTAAHAQAAPAGDLAQIRARADSGDSDAQNVMGNVFTNALLGMKQDYAEALRWYKRAADKAFAPAEFNLGLAYELGRGVPADDRQAFKYYLMAAEQGFASAQFNVGNMYSMGRGVGQDLFEANLWYKQAAEKGVIDAQFYLGLAYDAGRGVKKDEVQAARWYKQAADHGFARAQYNLALLLEDGRGVAKNEAGAATFYRAAADQGFAAAQNNYGVMISEGRGGLAKDPVQAYFWLSLAAANGSNPAARDFVARSLTAEQLAAGKQLLEDRKAGKAQSAPAPAAVGAAQPGPETAPAPAMENSTAARVVELAAALDKATQANSQFAEANQKLELEKARLEQELAGNNGNDDSAKLVDQLRQQSSRLSTQVQSLTADKETAERDAKIIATQVKDLQDELTRVKSTAAAPAPAAANADDAKNQAQIAGLTDQLAQATAALGQAQKARQDLTEANARLQKEKDALAAAPPPATGSVADNTKYPVQSGDKDAIIASLKKDNARLDGEVKSSIRELMRVNAELRATRHSGGPQIVEGAAGSDTAVLDDQLKDARSEITRLNQRVVELSSASPAPGAANDQVAQLTTKVAQAAQETGRLQTENDRLTARVAELQKPGQPAVDDSLAPKLAAAQQQVQALQTEKADLEKWSRSLEKALNEKTTAVESAGGEAADLRVKLDQSAQALAAARQSGADAAAVQAKADQLTHDNADLTRKLAEGAEAAATGQQALQKLTADNAALTDRAQQAEAALAVRPATKPAADETGPLRQQLAEAQDLTDRLTREKQSLADKVGAEHTNYIQAQARVASLEADLRTAQKKPAPADTAALDDLKKQLADANTALDKSGASVAELTAANDRLEKQAAAAGGAQSDLAAAKTQLADLQQQLTAARQPSADLTNLQDENRRLHQAADEASAVKAKADQLARDNDQLTAQMSDSRRDLTTAQARVAALEKQAAESIPTVRTQGGDDTAKLRSDLTDANQAVDKLNATVADLTATNDRLTKDLDSAKKGTAAALAAQAQAVNAAQPDAYKMEISTLQARVKELEAQIEDERGNAAKAVATIADQLARTRETNKSLTEANRALLNAKQADTPTVDKDEFDRLQAKVHDLAALSDDARRQNQKLADDNDRLTADQATLKQQLEDARKAATTASAQTDEKAALQERLEAVGTQLVKAQQDVDTLQKENADATSQALASKQAADKAQADLAALQGRAADAEKAADAHNTSVAELTDANTKLDAERTDLRSQLAALKTENIRLSQTSSSLQQLKADADRSAQQNIDALTAQLAQARRDLQSARDANSRLVEGNVSQDRDRAAVVASLQQQNSALAARLTQAQGTLDQIASAARLGTPAAAIASGNPVPIPVVSTAPAGAEVRYHTVAEGDSLSRISMRYYGTPGRWQEIYNANRDVLQGSSTLRVGMQLRIP